jgi:large subunit ribosomal protein L29
MKRREELDKYRDLTKEELAAEAARLKESLFRLKFKLALGEVDAVKRIRQEKKSLARIQTLTGGGRAGKRGAAAVTTGESTDSGSV